MTLMYYTQTLSPQYKHTLHNRPHGIIKRDITRGVTRRRLIKHGEYTGFYTAERGSQRVGNWDHVGHDIAA
jgi:hypothetical protein